MRPRSSGTLVSSVNPTVNARDRGHGGTVEHRSRRLHHRNSVSRESGTGSEGKSELAVATTHIRERVRHFEATGTGMGGSVQNPTLTPHVF